MRRTARGHDGQATVELALVLPILAVIVLAFLEVAMLGADQIRVVHAAREGARVAAVKPGTTDIEAAVEASGLPGASVEVRPPEAERRQGGAVTVEVTYGPEARIPLIGALFDGVTLSSVATMRVEQP